MNSIDLIIALTKMPTDVDVAYDGTNEGEELIRLITVDEIALIETDKGEKFILLNPTVDERHGSI